MEKTMKRFISIVLGSIASITLLVGVPLMSATSGTAMADKQATGKNADFLFVQTAKSMSFDNTTNILTLQGVSPITLFFSDRPDRIAGNMQTTAFIPFWSKGKDSFLKDAPNADLSILEGGTLRQIVVVLEDPKTEGDTLAYKVRVLKGAMPEKASDVSVFIDIIGMPLTPMSYAGVARRGFRRGVMY
jgi:hypothetical protein